MRPRRSMKSGIPAAGSILFVLVVVCATSASFAAPDPFRLKPGAKGKVCLACHQAFKETLGRPFVHTPVKAGDCSDCHNPHSARHGKLLGEDPNRICLECHDGIVPSGAKSAHQVAASGNCVECHDPHAANNRFNLKVSGNDLCFGCHEDVADAVRNNKYKHILAQKECLACHDPHASSGAAFLQKEDVPALCVRCHNVGSPMIARQHMGYPMEKAPCTTCHNPHGSNRSGILQENIHSPVARNLCNQCHQDPASSAPLGLKREGIALCRGCHNDTVGDILTRNRVHWPVVGKGGCTTCHNPHGSKQGALLADAMTSLCGRCHSDTIDRQERAAVKHEPVEGGECTRCHSPHASDNPLLFDNTLTLTLCGKCHEWEKHSTHPIGEKIVDPRNQALAVDCRSCHSSHGSDHEYFAYADPKKDLCVMCHQGFRR